MLEHTADGQETDRRPTVFKYCPGPIFCFSVLHCACTKPRSSSNLPHSVFGCFFALSEICCSLACMTGLVIRAACVRPVQLATCIALVVTIVNCVRFKVCGEQRGIFSSCQPISNATQCTHSCIAFQQDQVSFHRSSTSSRSLLLPLYTLPFHENGTKQT